MKRLVKFLKRVFLALFLAIISFFIYDFLNPITLQRASDVSKILKASDGSYLYVTTNSEQKWRFKPNLKKIDPNYIRLLLSFEDKRFYKHGGVDFLAAIRATKQLILNRKVVSGASTVTMQVARLLEPKERTFLSKIKEMIRAWQLELHYTKDEILEAYLTLAPYGGNIEGVVAASLRYYGKMPYSLTHSQIAMLIAMPQSPERNRVDRHYKLAKKSRDKVLKELLDKEVITKLEYKEAIGDSLKKELHKMPRLAPHLSIKLLKNSHLIDTTINKKLQQQLEFWSIRRSYKLPKGVTFALLVVENSSSKVRAYIGSSNMFSNKFSGYVDMVNAIRSPGSTLKPFIYTLGFEKTIINPDTIIKDVQTKFGDYMPHNFSREYLGDVTIAYSLQKSLNIPAVKVLQRVGVDDLLDRVTSIAGGVKVPKDKTTLPIALGGLGMSLWQLSDLYCNLANLGESKKIRYLKSLKEKKILVFTKSAALKSVNILREVTPPRGFVDFKRQIAYKTGTSYGFRDSWCFAFSKDYSVGVWVGRPDGKPQVNKTGLNTAAPIAFNVMSIIEQTLSFKRRSYGKINKNYNTPAVIKYFDKKVIDNRDKLAFLLPEDNSKFVSADCSSEVAIEFKIKTEDNNLLWYVDSKEVSYKKSATILFKSGAHSIVVVDKNGNRAKRDIWVNSPNCEQ